VSRSGKDAGWGGRGAAPAVFIALMLMVPAVTRAAGTAAVSVSATVLSRSVCRFDTRTLALVFGNIDPESPADVTATATVGFRCGGSANPATFAIVADSGLHGTGGFPRMQSGLDSSRFLPYFLGLNPATGSVPRNTNQTLTITGTIRRSDFQDAFAGTYTDTVVLSILP
jgi:spore coat protein U-like protein